MIIIMRCILPYFLLLLLLVILNNHLTKTLNFNNDDDGGIAFITIVTFVDANSWAWREIRKDAKTKERRRKGVPCDEAWASSLMVFFFLVCYTQIPRSKLYLGSTPKRVYVKIKPKNHKIAKWTFLDQEHFPSCISYFIVTWTNKNNQQKQNKFMPLEIENKTYSITFVATNLMQTIKLLELHKIEEVAFGDSSWNLSPKKHKTKPNKKIMQKNLAKHNFFFQ